VEEDNFKPDCDNVKRNIKSFMEDMLKEDEYRAFLHHLEICSECKNYVKSVDSFSNQLWRLGEVKVPSDFSSTVLFELTQPEEELPEEEAPATSKKWLIGAVAFILVAMIISAGLIGYFKLRQPSQEEVQIVQVPEILEEPVQQLLDDQDNNVELGQFDDFDDLPDESEEQVAFEWTGESVGNEAASEAKVDAGPKLLHWHFLHYDKTKELQSLRLRRQKRNKESDLRKKINEKEQLDPASEAAIQVDSTIKGLEEEIRQINAKLEQNLTEKGRREGGPLSVLQYLDIRPDYQDSDFIFFAASGDGIKSVLDQIALISEDGSPLDDFTPGASHLPHKKYQVSIYMVKKETSVLHWHVHLAMMNQKSQLLKTIQENGGVTTYEFAEEVTISVSSSKIEDIKAKMPAMRISVSEYGNQVAQGEESEAEPVVISIYFSK